MRRRLLLFTLATLACVPATAGAASLKNIHPEFHARLGMTLQIEASGAAGDRLRVTVASPDGTRTLRDEPVGDATLRWDMRGLVAGDHTLTTSVVSEGGFVLKTISEPFKRSYSGVPTVGFDEYNGVFRDGKPVFHVNGFIFNGNCSTSVSPLSGEGFACFNVWGPVGNGRGGNGYVNGNVGMGYYPDGRDLLANWTDQLDKCAAAKVACNLGFVGTNEPDHPDSTNNVPDSEFVRRIEAIRDKPGLSMYQWSEEPDLGHPVSSTADQVRRWTDVSHANDEQRPVRMNFTGDSFKEEPLTDCDPFAFCAAKGAQYTICRIDPTYFDGASTQAIRDTCGGVEPKPLVADMIAFDYYPLDQHYNGIGGKQENFDWLVRILRNMRNWTKGTVPFGSYVETVPVNSRGISNPSPTPGEVWGQSWINIAGGARELNWFPFFGEQRTDVLATMKRVVDTTGHYVGALMGAESGAVSKVSGGSRVMHIARRDPAQPGRLFVFAVNADVDSGVEASFTAEGCSPASVRSVDAYDGLAAVGERSLAVTSGAWSDTFVPLGVRVYELACDGSEPPPPPPPPPPPVEPPPPPPPPPVEPPPPPPPPPVEPPPPPPPYAPACKPDCDDIIAKLTGERDNALASLETLKAALAKATERLDRIGVIAERNVYTAKAAVLRQRLLDIRAIGRE